MDDEFEFEFEKELPKRTNPSAAGYLNPEREKLAKACRAHPGEWLKVPPSYYAHLRRPNGFAHTIKNGESLAFTPAGSFDARVRGGMVYMMYKGTPS